MNHILQSFRKSMSQRTETVRQRIRDWTQDHAVQRAQSPTNPVRARSLGYKAKKGYIIVRVRVKRGKRSRPAPRMGRKPGKNVKRVPPGRSLQQIAQARAQSRFLNMKVLNSYLAGNDGTHLFYEVILREKG